ncbi:NLI interacting factor-like phosphatase [Lotmaria passim]
MDGEQETNATPTSFFRGISDKLDSQHHQQGGKVASPCSVNGHHPSTVATSSSSNANYRGSVPSSSVSPALYAASTKSAHSNNNNNNNGAATLTTLITQVSQQHLPANAASRNGSRAGSCGEADNSASNNNNGGRTGGSYGSVRQSSSNSYSGGGMGGSRQRVHATELVERARYIRNQPKNTSPIDASAHPSLLPEPLPLVRHKKCLILDVDETLVHSSYQSNARYDVHLPIQLDRDTQVNVYVAFRPYLRHFLDVIAPLFEIVVFTASLSTYCDPLMNSIDSAGILGGLRLFREHCSVVGTTYVKDLSLLGRNLDQVAIIDNSPIAYLFQQRNAIPITSWFDDPNDEELLRLIPVLEALAEADTVYDVLDNYNALLQLQQLQEGNGEV